MKIRACILGLALLPALALGFSLNRNAAQIDWRTVETEHFRIHYPKELEGVAAYVAGVAESVAQEKIQRYRLKLPNKVEFTIRDDIYSNGWANALENSMNVWVTDWDFPVRSTHNWIRDVVTHEFSHLVSIQSGSKLPAFVQGLVIGYQSYYNAPVQGNLATIIPFTEQPNWFAEGVAQYESSIAGFDAWDSHRDMILRVACLNNKLISIDRMGTFTGTGLQYEQGPYTQGFALVRYISQRYGDAAIPKLWSENARIYRQTFSGAAKVVLGVSDRELYEEWKNDITEHYTEQVQALGHTVEGQKLTSAGFYNYYPRWDHQGRGIFFVGNPGSETFRSTLQYLKIADTAKAEDERYQPIAGVHGYFDVGRDDSTFLFASALATDSEGIHKIDLYQRNVRRQAPFFEGRDPTEKRFTFDLNADQANYSPDGKHVTFVRAVPAGFKLCIAPVPSGRKLPADSIRTLFPSDSVSENEFGFNVYTPKFSPDGSKILFSYYDLDSRKIGMINTDGTGFTPLLTRRYDQRDPEWAPDGKSFFFSSDTNGIYNIYRYTFATHAIEALTNVVGGAFAPAVDPAGKRLAFINYDADGFSLYLLNDLKPLAHGPVGVRFRRVKLGPIEPIDCAGHSQPYSPVPTRGILTPILYGEQMIATTPIAREGQTKWLGGVTGYWNDPVLKNEINAGLLLQLGNGFDYFGTNSDLLSPDQESQFFVGASNHSTPVTLGVDYFRGNLTTDDTVTLQDQVAGQNTAEIQNYAITFRDAEASASYNLFDAEAVGDEDQTNYVSLTGGYAWNDFNFYNLGGGQGFDFTYYRDLFASAQLNLSSSNYSDKSLVAPTGMAASLAYTLSQSDLMRNGTFAQTFTFNSNGTLSPVYRTYQLNELDGGFSYSLPMPWARHSALVASGFVGSLLDWNLTTKNQGPDTLDSFFQKGLTLRGYPYLRDIEDLAFGGENAVSMSFDMNQPVWPNIYRRFWTVLVEDLYLDAFWEAGRAWNGPLWDLQLFSPSAWQPEIRTDGWYQSVGLSLKVNAVVYHNYPFLLYFQAAAGLSGIPDGHGGLMPLSDIYWGSLNTHATRIAFGISFGLYNGLLRQSEARNPMNPKSPFDNNRW